MSAPVSLSRDTLTSLACGAMPELVARRAAELGAADERIRLQLDPEPAPAAKGRFEELALAVDRRRRDLAEARIETPGRGKKTHPNSAIRFC